MSDHAAVLFTNDAFYVAFVNRDVEAMDSIWSAREGITCIHPGWPALRGRDAVMESWAAILHGPNPPRIACHDAHAHLLGTVAYVTCYEAVDDSFLTATNVFILETDGWRMVHHQAGTSPPPSEFGEAKDIVQ